MITAPVLAIVFGFPAAAYFAAAGLPVLAAFMYRRRSREVEVPAVSLWEQIGRPVEVRSFASLIRRLLSLAVQMLLVGLLVAALADPWPARVAARRTVLVLDVSATMQTREGSVDRMELARRKATDVIRSTASDQEMIVILAGHSPVLAQPPVRDPGLVLRTVQRQQAQDADGDLAAAVKTASAFADPVLPTDVVVVSDFAAAAPQALRDKWRGPGRLRLVAVGHDQPDLCVTDFWSEPASADPAAGVRSAAAGPANDDPANNPASAGTAAPGTAATDVRRVVARLGQHGMAGRHVPVHLLVNGQVAATHDVVLDPGTTTVEFSAIAPGGSVLQLHVDSGDPLSVDDAAYAVVSAREGTPVCLVTHGSPALERALRADASIRLKVVSPELFRGPEGALVVVVDTPNLPAQDPRAWAASGCLFVGTADPFGWATVRARVQAGPVTHWAGGHPALLGIDPTLMRIPEALGLDWATQIMAPASAPQAATRIKTDLISADRTPLVVAVTTPQHEGAPAAPANCIYWLFDLASTDLPRRMSFPLLLWNTIDFLAGRSADAATAPVVTGQPLPIAAGASAHVVGPDGSERAIHFDGKAAAVLETTRQGIYVCHDGPGADPYAVNLLSPRGAAALPVERPDEVSETGKSLARSAFSDWKDRLSRPGWEPIVLAAIGLGLCEWLLFHRRIVQVG